MTADDAEPDPEEGDHETARRERRQALREAIERSEADRPDDAEEIDLDDAEGLDPEDADESVEHEIIDVED